MSASEKAMLAVGAVVGGLVLGALIGWWLRRWMSQPQRIPALRGAASAASLFTFWLATATGIVVALAVTSPETLEPIPAAILAYLPRVLVAGVIVIGGRVLASAASAALGRVVERTSGRREPMAERGARLAIGVAAAILALSQLGVDTTILTLLVTALVAAVAGAFALLAGLGGRDVASHMAAGRALQGALVPGSELRSGDVTGTIVRLHAATVEIDTGIGSTHVPYGQLLTDGLHVLPPITTEA